MLSRTSFSGTRFAICTFIFAFSRGDLLANDELAAAQKAKVALEETDARFLAGMQRLAAALDKAIESIPASGADSDLTSELDAIRLLSRMNDRLIEEYDPVLAAQEEYLALGRQFLSDLKTAEPTFKAAADECRVYAAKESHSDHREDYVAMAGIFDELAARSGQVPEDLTTQVKAVEELLPYLQSGRRVLERFQKVLAAIPVLKSTREFKALDVRLKAYALHHEEFRGSLRKLHERLLSDRPAEPNLNQASFRPRPASTNTNREPTRTIRFVGGSSARNVPHEPTFIKEPEPTLASPLADDELYFRPIRDVLQYDLPGDSNRESKVKAWDSVEVGSQFHLRTREMGTVLLNVTRKLHVSDDGQTQFWLAELDSNRRLVPIAK